MKKTFINKRLFVCIAALLLAASSFAQTITTGTITPATVCAGATISVEFDTSGTFPANTEFTLQLSDASGAFGTPVAIGTGKVSPIEGLIPSGSLTGTGYKTRVISTTPAVEGGESAALAINALPQAPVVTSPVTYETGATATALTATGTALKWYNTAASTTSSGTAPIPSTATVGTRSYFVTQTVGGCESEKAEIVITVSACTPPAAPTVSNKNYIVGETATALTATGTALKWYNTAASTTSSETAPIPSTATVGTRSYFVTQTVGGCESEKAEIVVTVSACTPPAAPTVTNRNYIVGATATALTATGTALKWYDTAASTTPLTAAPTPSTATVGTRSYFVTQTVGGCESEKAEIVVTVSACTPPAAPTVTNRNYIVGATATALTATGTALKWYDSAASTTPLTAAPTPSTATVGTRSYFVTQTVGGCESSKAEIVVTVSACTPPAAPTTSNVSYCIGATASALTATGTALKWYDTLTSTAPLGSAPTPSTTSAGVRSYYVTQTIGCESPRAKIDVTVLQTAPPTISTTPISYCINATATALTATGTALKWYTAASGGSGTTTAIVPATNVAGTKSYYVSQTLNGCESQRAKIDVIVNQTAAPTVATSPVEYCLDATATALTATGTALKWYTTASGGTGTTTAIVPATNAAGTKSYYATQTLNGCESPRTEIKVTVRAISTTPTLTAGQATLNICQNSTPNVLTANGVNLKWYSEATGGTALSAAPRPNSATAGTVSYYVTQTVANSCESPRTKIDVIVKDTPAAPTVATVEYCQNVVAQPLTPSGAAYKWYDAATGGSGTTTAPTPSTASAGTKSHYVTQSNSYTISGGTLSCESPRTKVDVITNILPATAIVKATEICQEKETKILTLSATAATGNTIAWYKAATGGTKETTTPTVDLKTPGTTSYYAVQVTSKACESPSRAEVKVRVKPLPSVPNAPELIQWCQFVKAEPLSAIPVQNGVLNWYGTNQTGGTASGEAPVPSTAEGGTTSYYVAQTLEGCQGDRAKIDVRINTTPKPQTETYLAYCQGVDAPRLEATGNVLKWYRYANDTEFQGFPFTPFTEKVEDYSFFVTQTGAENGCESPKEEIKIHIKAKPSATISGNQTIDLGQTANISIRFTGDGPWKYTLSNGLTDSTNTSPAIIPVTPVTTTSYLVTKVSNECGDGIPAGSALVTVTVPTISSGNPSVAELCAGTSFRVPFQQSGDFPDQNTFKVQISLENIDSLFYSIPSVTNGNQVTATLPDTTLGGQYFIRIISSGDNPDFLIKGSVSAIGVTVNPIPVATLSGSTTILIGESADLRVEFTGKGPWSFNLNNGTSDSLITSTSSPYSFKVAPRSTTIYKISSVSNSCGNGTGRDSARIQVDPILGTEPPVTDWIKVYPTLIETKCTVEIDGAISPKTANIKVLNLNGVPMLTMPISQKTTDLDFSGYPSGLYLLQVSSGNLNAVYRVMKP